MPSKPIGFQTRQFHVDIEDNKGKIWSVDISISKEVLSRLAQNKNLEYPLIKDKENAPESLTERVKSKWEKETDVIRSLANQSFLSADKKKARVLDLVVIDESRMTIQQGSEQRGQNTSLSIQPETTLKPSDGEQKLSSTTGYKAIRIEERTDYRPILERFSKQPKFTGKYARLQRILHPIMTRLGKMFESIGTWWKQLVGLGPMPWNMEALARACRIGTKDDVCLQNALDYMASVTLRSDAALSDRLTEASKHITTVNNASERLQKTIPQQMTPKDAGKLQKELFKSLEKISSPIKRKIELLTDFTFSQEAVYLPIPQVADQDMLLVFTRDSAGTFTVDIHNGLGSFASNTGVARYTNLTIDEVKDLTDASVLRGLGVEHFEILLSQNLDPNDKKDIPKILNILQSKQKSNPTVGIAASRKMKGPLGVISSLAVEKSKTSSKGSEEYVDLALRIRIFVDMCGEASNWLHEREYHEGVRITCYQLIDELNTLLKDVSDVQVNRELTSLLGEVEKVLGELNRVTPKIAHPNSFVLTPLGSGNFPNIPPPPDDVGKLVPKKLVRNMEVDRLASLYDPVNLTEVQKDFRTEYLSKDMTNNLTYLNLRGSNIIDAMAVKPETRATYFPELTRLPLTNDEQMSLIYTLHNQTMNDTIPLTPLNVRGNENLAKAHYTFFTLVRHPKIGRSAEAQEWLLHQLFTENRIQTLLNTKTGQAALESAIPAICKEIDLLLETLPHFTTYQENITSALFLLRVLKNIDTTNIPGVKGKIKEVDDNVREKLKVLGKFVKDPNAQRGQSTFLAEYLYSIHQKYIVNQANFESITAQELATCLSALIRVDTKFLGNKRLEQTVEAMKIPIYGLAKQKLKKQDSDFVQTFCAKVGGEAAKNSNLGWTLEDDTFPTLTADKAGQKVQLDLTTGQVFTGDFRAAEMPRDVYENEDVARLFPEAPSLLWILSSPETDETDTTAYSHPIDKNVRVVVTKNTTFIERKVPGSDTDWAVYTYFPAQKALAEGTEPAQSNDDIPLVIAAAIGAKTCWQSRNEHALYIFDTTGAHYGTYSEVDGESTLLLSDGRVLLTPDEEALTQFVQLENSERLNLYGDEGRPSKVEYPCIHLHGTEIPLSFEIEDHAITTPQFLGWKLAPHGKRPGIALESESNADMPETLRSDVVSFHGAESLPSGFTAFHLLEKDGQQKILIPGRKLEVTKNPYGKMIKGTFSTRTVPKENFAPSPLYEYSLNIETNRLETTTAEGYFHLAYISLVHKDYGAASHYMSKAQSGIGDTKRFHEIAEFVQEVDTKETKEGSQVKLRLLLFAERVRKRRVLEIRQAARVTGERKDRLEPVDSPYKTSIVECTSQPNLRLSTEEQKELASITNVQLSPTQIDEQVEQDIQTAANNIGNTEDASGTDKSRTIVTRPEQAKEIVGLALTEETGTAFKIKQQKHNIADKNLFTTLEKDQEPAVVRVAKTYREDLETYESKEETNATITALEATQLKDNIVKKRDEAAEAKAEVLNELLSIVGPTAQAGVVAAEKVLGERESPTLQTLLQLWIGDSLFENKSSKILEDLSGRKLSEKEIEQLDWLLINYMLLDSDLSHLNRLVDSADAYITSCGGQTVGDAQLGQNFYNLTTTKRQYFLLRNDASLTIPNALNFSRYSEKAKDAIKAQVRNFPKPESVSKDVFESQIDMIIGKLDSSDPTAAMEKISAIRLKCKRKSEGEAFERALLDLFNSPNLLMQLAGEVNDADYRNLLALEYATGFVLRPDQVTIFRDMLSHPNNVRQLGMGGGKSKVILPLLAKRKATGKNLVGLLLPDDLYETNRFDLDTTNRQLFGQSMYCFEYNRYSDLQSGDYKEIYKTLLQTIADKGFIATTKGSLLSFRDAYLTKLSELDTSPVEDRKELLVQIHEMGRILKLLKERMDVIADEVDLCLNVKQEVNFALGDPIPIDKVKSAVGLECFQLIFTSTNKQLQALSQRIGENTQAQMSPEGRERTLEELAGVYWDKHSNNNQAGEGETWTRVNLGDRSAFISYVMKRPDIKEMPQFMKDLKGNKPELFKEVSSFKGFINRGLSITLKKTCMVNYGPHPHDEKNPFTFPWDGPTKPLIHSEFDDDIERVCHTLQSDAQRQIPESLLREAIGDFLREANRELLALKSQAAAGEKPRYQDTQAYSRFRNFVEEMDPKNDKGISRNLLDYGTEDEGIAILCALINTSPLSKITFSKTFTVDQKIRVFPDQQSSKAEDLVDMVHGFSGFTGTPWNLHTYHDKILSERNLGVDGKTFNLLLRKDSPVKVIKYNPRDAAGSLINRLEFDKSQDDAVSAVIDTAALLRGVTSQNFVEKVMKKNPSCNLGVYCDSTGRIVGRKKDGKQLPTAEVGTQELESRFTLYAGGQTTGFDVKQHPKAVAAVTIGESTTTRDLFQAVWRLRELDKEQDIQYVVTEEVKHLIMGRRTGEPTAKDILEFCLRNEVNEEADVNFRAENGKIRGLPSRIMFDELVKFGAALDPTKDQSLGQTIDFVAPQKPHLVKKRPGDESFDHYAAVDTPKDSASVLEEAKAETLREIETALSTIEGADNKPVLRNLQGALSTGSRTLTSRHPKPTDWFPSQVSTVASQEGQQVEAQAEVEIAVQQQVQMLLMVEQEVEQIEDSPEAPAQEAGGETEVTARPVKHDTINSIQPLSSQQLLQACNSFDNRYRSLRHVIGAFDEGILIGGTYEGRLNNPDVYIYNDDDARQFGQIGVQKMSQPHIRAGNILHSQRLPVNEALFFKGADGWRVIFGSTHDSYCSFSEYPATTQTPAALVHIGPLGPTPITTNQAYIGMSQEDKKEFMRLYVQMKFLKGEVTYDTLEEREALRNWIIEKGPHDMRNLFEKGIRPTKTGKDQLGYKGSWLKKLFDELTPSQIKHFEPQAPFLGGFW